jgi:quercetin dioxygenase-like cupin family protein
MMPGIGWSPLQCGQFGGAVRRRQANADAVGACAIGSDRWMMRITLGDGGMTVETAGITRAGQGLDGVVWNILGQTYKPLQHCTESFAFDSLFPPGTFVPPHIHPTQHEYIRVLEGTFSLMLGGAEMTASAGDLIRMPMGIPHGIWNKTTANVRAVFWVAPAQRLYDLFTKIHDVTDPAEVVRLAALHDVQFLPPPG